MFNMRTLLVEKKDGIGWIRFHRPEARNAVNLEMMYELEEIIEEWKKDPDLRVVVFRGDRTAFVSGGDIAEFHQMSREEIQPVMRRMGAILERIGEWEVVTVSAIEGPAVGGGCEIAVSTDLCLASERAIFGMIQVNLGITTGWGGGSRLLRKIGISSGLELLLTGERISGTRAWELGLVDRLLPDERFDEELHSYIRRLSEAPPEVVQAYKRLAIEVGRGVPSSELFVKESENCASGWNTERHRKAVESFLRRTRPGRS
jgi:enoyl-CoA hydratase/carnithine racemase